MKYFLEIEGERVEVELKAKREGYLRILFDGREYDVEFLPIIEEGIFLVFLCGKPYLLSVEVGERGRRFVETSSKRYDIIVRKGEERHLRGSTHLREEVYFIRAPMAGLVTEVFVKEGDRVSKSKGLMVLEAMKMRNEIKSPIEGTVAEVLVRKGESVKNGQSLLSIRRSE